MVIFFSQNAVTISVLLGITWIFGFLAIDEATFAFQLLFCLFNAFQGFIVFLLFCLRQEDVRKTLAPYVARCTTAWPDDWLRSRWSAVSTRATTHTAVSSNGTGGGGGGVPGSPTTTATNQAADSSTAADLASTTDMSMSEVMTPLTPLR